MALFIGHECMVLEKTTRVICIPEVAGCWAQLVTRVLLAASLQANLLSRTLAPEVVSHLE